MAVQEQILELQIAMHYALLVQVADTRDELRKQPPRRVVFEVAVVQDVVEELASRRVLEHDTYPGVVADHVVKVHDVRV